MHLSIIVPAYNEGKRIYNNLKTIDEVISKFTDDFEIVPVNDGSKDNTHDEIMRLASENSRIYPVSYPDNQGKGGAIIEGVKNSEGDFVGFLDADLDISPNQIEAYVTELLNQQADVVIASKMHKDSKLEYPFARKVFSTGYYVLLKILFGLKLKDTQTGLKIYKGDLIRSIVPKLRVRGFAFDIEILALANSMNAKIIEMPVRIEYTRDTSFGRIRVKDIFKMFTDTLGIWWKLNVTKRYSR